MVNPGAFHGSRKLFLETALPEYFKAVREGYGPEFLQTTVRRYLKRYPIEIGEDSEPTAEFLASVNDDEASPDVYPPTKDPNETEETFEARVAAFEQQKKDMKAKLDQIVRWFKYRYNKQHEGAMKGEPHPLDILLANLAGISLTKPGRMRTAYNVWGKENQELIDELIAERLEKKNGYESQGVESCGDEQGEMSKKKGKKGKKKAKKFVRNGEEAYLAVRQEITMAEFAKLPEDLQQEWKTRAEEEHKLHLESWKAGQKAEFSTAPEDRQKCIDRLVKFLQPILDGVLKATGWPCTFLAGGPEPADAGRLNILSIHSGTTSGPVPLTFGTACRPAFKKYWIPIFTAFLQMCFTMEESKARGLVDSDTPCLREQLAEQEETTTATVDEVEMLSRDSFLNEIKEMMNPKPVEAAEKGKGKEVAPEKTTETDRSAKIAKLRENASQRKKNPSPAAGSSALQTQEATHHDGTSGGGCRSPKNKGRAVPQAQRVLGALLLLDSTALNPIYCHSR
ncbi:SERTA domain-containing protein 3 [Marasmius crinis-equi]|uniref:SERTA domain-containing protein 3 n=1 Tax=Marasmius crinis-equi TaxID=585013 RepID=A0ABR3FHN1_9AGAR